MSTETHGSEAHEHEDHDEAKDTLKVTVFAPRFPKGRKFSWSDDLTVAAAAQEAATEFGYGAGNFTLQRDGVALQRDKSLEAAGVESKDELGLVDTGGGV